jgi:hypothetical protein
LASAALSPPPPHAAREKDMDATAATATAALRPREWVRMVLLMFDGAGCSLWYLVGVTRSHTVVHVIC